MSQVYTNGIESDMFDVPLTSVDLVIFTIKQQALQSTIVMREEISALADQLLECLE